MPEIAPRMLNSMKRGRKREGGRERDFCWILKCLKGVQFERKRVRRSRRRDGRENVREKSTRRRTEMKTERRGRMNRNK